MGGVTLWGGGIEGEGDASRSLLWTARGDMLYSPERWTRDAGVLLCQYLYFGTSITSTNVQILRNMLYSLQRKTRDAGVLALCQYLYFRTSFTSTTVRILTPGVRQARHTH